MLIDSTEANKVNWKLKNKLLFAEDLKVIPPNSQIEGTHLGIKYIIARNGNSHLCGYTYLDPESPHCKLNLTMSDVYWAHGGITHHSGNEIGFDAAHSCDWTPTFSFGSKSTYKNTEYIRNQLIQLIEQIVQRQKQSESQSQAVCDVSS